MAGQSETEPGMHEAPEEKKGKRFAWWYLLIVVLIAVPCIMLVRMPETPLERAIKLIKANKPAAALPILEEIQKQPDNNLYLPWLAQCYLSTDRIAEGRTALDTAMKIKLPSENVVPVVLSFSKYYRQKNDFAEAEKLLMSVQALCPAREFQAERKEIYTQWAEDEASKNQIAQAIAHLEMLASIDGTNANSEKVTHMLAELYRQQAAIEETQNGNEAKAIELLEKSLTISDEPASRMALANLYVKNNDFKRAIVHLAQVCKSDPNNLEARHKLIDSSLKIDDYKGAQEAATELSERERCVENYQMLARIDLKLGNYAGAVRALEEANSLGPKDLDILASLEEALHSWVADLVKQGKQEESLTVKVRAERVADTIKAIEKELNPEEPTEKPVQATPDTLLGNPSVALTASRIWLSKGSFTPEGEIKLKNVGTEPVAELALTVAIYDKTSKKRTGSVTVSAAGSSHPMLPGQTRVLYFSSPNIVRAEHQLSVLIYWKGKLIRELPVVKEH